MAARTILRNHLPGEMNQLAWRDGSTIASDIAQHVSISDRIDASNVLRLKPSDHILFGGKPNVSLRGPNDIPGFAVEVKAGADPAALGRLGATLKPLENDRDSHPRVKAL